MSLIRMMPWGAVGTLVLCSFSGVRLLALEPPRPGELEQYARDGTLAQRLANAEMLGNHVTDPGLVARTRQRLTMMQMRARGASNAEIAAHIAKFSPPFWWQGGLPATGSPKVFVLLIDFPDYPHTTTDTVEDVRRKFFGEGDAGEFPYESLSGYYQRSSYNQLNIQGDVYGWYRAAHPRTYYSGSAFWTCHCYPICAREALIIEALNYFAHQGHDFTQYDNDGDGQIESFYVEWTGPDDGFVGFWWACTCEWCGSQYGGDNAAYRIQGKSLGKYVWSWIWNPEYYGNTIYQPHVDIHETGHLLGLPDLYQWPGAVPFERGGAGALDMMDHNWGDLNCFSKFMLEWLEPTFIVSGSQMLTLQPSGLSSDSVLIMPSSTYAEGTIFDEFYMAQYRMAGTGNDPGSYAPAPGPYPTDGIVVWHIDATLDDEGKSFRYSSNGTSPHKLVRLMEADGLEEVAQGQMADAGDFYVPPKEFGWHTTPNSSDYAGTITGVTIDQLSAPGGMMSARFSVVDRALLTLREWAITSESLLPANGFPDPQEHMTISVTLQNIGLSSTASLVATLLPTGGVSSPSGPESYGAMLPSGSAITRTFSFDAQAACGDNLTATLLLQDGESNLDPVVITVPVGGTRMALTQTFNAPVPDLPPNWTSMASTPGSAVWMTSSFAGGLLAPACQVETIEVPTDVWLESPNFGIATTTAQLSFRHEWGFEAEGDGAVLEIALGNGPFVDICTAGGSFWMGSWREGGYKKIISAADSPIYGRWAWTGVSPGATTTIVNLPVGATENSVRLRWRLVTVNGGGWWRIDDIVVTDGRVCAGPPPALIGATSVKEHGTAGEYRVPLPLSGGTRGVECRKNGPTKLELTFSKEVRAVDGFLDASELAISPVGQVSGVSIAGHTLTVTLSNVPDESCLTVSIPEHALADLDGNALAGDRDLEFIALRGDINSDGRVDILDVETAKANSGATLDQSTFRCDLSLDGMIASGDVSMAKACSGHVPSCVTDPGPRLHGAVSRKPHGQSTYYELLLPIDTSSGVAVEGRTGGPTEVRLTLSEPVLAVDGTIDTTEVSVNAGTVTGVTVLGPGWLSVQLSNVPDRTCLVVGLRGLTDLRGHDLTTPNSVTIPVLFADVNSNLVVDGNDETAISAAVGESGYEYLPLDINCDGIVNNTDAYLAGQAISSQPLVCP